MTRHRDDAPTAADTDPTRPRFIDARRRGLLQGVAAAAAGATVVGNAADAAPEPLETAPSEPAPPRGYRLTDHVREYYAKARF